MADKNRITRAEHELAECEREAVEAKAKELVGLVFGTMALEGQVLTQEQVDEMVHKTVKELNQMAARKAKLRV